MMILRSLVIAMLMLFCTDGLFSQNYKPLLYWTFDTGDELKDPSTGKLFKVGTYGCQYKITSGIVKKGIDLGDSKCQAMSNAVGAKIGSKLTIEFWTKGNRFVYQSKNSPYLYITLNYPYIQFVSTTEAGTAKDRDNWIIQLNGSGRKSYNYYTDERWHHWVFTLDAVSGMKRIYVDGESPEDFGKKIKNGDRIVFDNADAFSYTSLLDEVAFYNTVIPSSLVYQHFVQAGNGEQYTFNVSSGIQKLQQEKKKSVKEVFALKNGYDVKEFAPGYPNYTVQAYDQLKSYPLARFKRGHDLNRNFPWTSIHYLHRELPGSGGKGFGAINPAKAVLLNEEMVASWNYYLDIPNKRGDSVAIAKTYNNPASIEYAIIQYANRHPEFPASTITFQTQINPQDAGYAHKGPYVNAQDLPPDYYLKNKKGIPVISNNKKWLSPLMPLDLIQRDGLTSGFYLRQLMKYLKRPLELISENGEVFGHMRSASLWAVDPTANDFYERSQLSNEKFNGWFQNRIDSTYKKGILQNSSLNKTQLSFYNLSATMANYWPDYSMRRNTNAFFRNLSYPTPSFYPSMPSNWRNSNGPLNGFGPIATGRLKEIELGDKYFSPFVCAGWGLEEGNIRPAQWLALLKAMSMLGAEFFYVGYFNVTGSKGWINGVGPNDPRGYIYQVAMPAYAQGITSRCWDFLERGSLLNAENKNNPVPFRFTTSRENELILIRKKGSQYLIYGSLQPVSNLAGNVPQFAAVTVRIDGKDIRFNIRRQGSMYVLDLSNAAQPVFYQLDGWHQYEHPYFWSRDFSIEAELPDNIETAKLNLTTECPGNKYDFVDFTTYVSMNSKSGTLAYDFSPRIAGKQYVYVKAKSRGKAILEIALDGKKSARIAINGNTGKWYSVQLTDHQIAAGAHTVLLKLIEGEADVDKLMITANESWSEGDAY